MAPKDTITDDFPFIQGDFVSGNLTRNVHAWTSLTNNSVIHEWVRNGITLPLQNAPEQFHLPNRQLSVKHTAFVDSEINSLLHDGAIEKVSHKPHCISPLGVVPKKGNKLGCKQEQ